MHSDDVKKNANAPPAAAKTVAIPVGLPHGTTQDQTNEMESEGQATKPGQPPAPATSGVKAPPVPGRKDENRVISSAP